MQNYTAKEGRTIAIISHFLIVGLVISYVLNLNKNNYFASFYIRQMIGFNLMYFIYGTFLYSFLGGWLVWIAFFALWLMSLISSIKCEEKEFPVIGSYFQDWFRSI